jgi:choline dehydrogenase-like flavoprotein
MSTEQHWDAVIVGTGFGGSMMALQLARAGRSVLVLDRGRWVDRDESAWDTTAILVDRKYKSQTAYEAPQFTKRQLLYPNDTIGGNSVFYGAASLRLREADFERRSRFRHLGDSADQYVDWPISYRELQPYYEDAERLLGVAGVQGVDPTEPPRTTDYVCAPPPYGSPARRIVRAAEGLGLHPFQLPLAINFGGNDGRDKCIQCMTCDLYPCKLGAKNDLSVTVLPAAMRHGATVRGETIVTKLRVVQDRVTGVECIDVATRQSFAVSCDVAVVSAGAIASPKILIASGLASLPQGDLIGKYLMRHCSGIIIGLCPFDTNPEQMFHKQVAITDFYFGGPSQPAGPWGMLQALQVPPAEYMEQEGPFPVNHIGPWTIRKQIFLLAIAEDMPNRDNRVEVHASARDPFGVPIATLHHRYARRDYAARRALYREGARILRRAGAWMRFRKPIYSFSHAVGSCRFGDDPASAVLDPHCRLFGVTNLFVVDGSFMPTSGGVNPSLTIAANALRVGRHVSDNWTAYAPI